jgi:hypothetical protein
MRFSIVLIAIMLSPTMSFAFVLGGSNLGIGGYPDHSCYEPIKPIKPYRFSSDYEVHSYNASVDSYNVELDSYMDCIKSYLDNAKNDIERIKEKYNETVQRAKERY